MYVPDVSTETDHDRVAQFIARHPLATLIAHTSTSNPTWKLAENRPEVLLVFSGTTAYVSPSLYPSKQQTHEVVPTYNYLSVHLRGHLEHSHERDTKLHHVTRLTAAMERTRAEPWSVSDAPAPYIEKMLNGVVALTFTVTSITAKTKASQNRLPQDQAGVARGLENDPATRDAAALVAARVTVSNP